MIDYGTCECCGREPAIGVAAVPGMPISIAWGKCCLAAGVIPYKLAVANTAAVGGLNNTVQWWRDIVDLTLAYFDRTHEQFARDVQLNIKGYANE